MSPLAPYPPAMANIIPPSGRMVFNVKRNNIPVGRNTITFKFLNNQLLVSTNISILVKYAFVTVYQYDAVIREIWQNDILRSINAQVNDNGKKYALRSSLNNQNLLLLRGAAGQVTAPVNIIPNTYWNKAILNRTTILDVQWGRLFNILVRPAGAEILSIANRQIQAEYYDIFGDVSMRLWYSKAGEWLKQQFFVDNAVMIYERSL